MAARWTRILVAGAVGAAVVTASVAIVKRDSAPEIATVASISIPDPSTVYDPVSEGEPLPEGYRVALPRDAILPVYAPEFTNGTTVDWPGDMLVIGVAGEDTAKAYPVTHMNSREMVIDSLDGIPILVSW